MFKQIGSVFSFLTILPSSNSTLNGDFAVEVFIEYICSCLNIEYRLTCDPTSVVDLESKYSEKFSRHLIFHLNNHLFVDNVQCGLFVKSCCASLKAFLDTGVLNKHIKEGVLESGLLSKVLYVFFPCVFVIRDKSTVFGSCNQLGSKNA